MSSGEWYKTSEILSILNNVGERRLRDLLHDLLEEGEIIEEGKTKGKKYRINNEE